LPAWSALHPEGRLFGEVPSRHLAKQWLEQVVVASIHNGYMDRLASEQAGRLQPTEAATDDDHFVRC
jgi:hypothetical protein